MLSEVQPGSVVAGEHHKCIAFKIVLFESFEDFLSRLKDFQKRVNARVHSSTKTPPSPRLVVA